MIDETKVLVINFYGIRLDLAFKFKIPFWIGFWECQKSIFTAQFS